MSLEGLDQREQLRQNVQAELDKQKTAVERNRLGQFATPTGLALQLAELGKEHLPSRQPVRFLDPGVGSGALFHAAHHVLGHRIESALGYEIDPTLVETAR